MVFVLVCFIGRKRSTDSLSSFSIHFSLPSTAPRPKMQEMGIPFISPHFRKEGLEGEIRKNHVKS